MASSHRGDLDLCFKEVSEAGGDKDDYSNSVASEGFPIAPSEPGSIILKPSAEVAGDEDTDDDCIILDGDPNKPLVLVANESNDDEELKIVGEKGKIACRDFPHPRYLCATFPFADTAHELHCGQCYCYVCDSLAPCTQWDTTSLSTDHCHATHNEEHWRTERRLVKDGELPVPVIPSMGDGTYLIQALRTPEFPTLDVQPPKPLTTGPINPSNVNPQNGVNQRSPPPLISLHRSNPQLQLLSPPSHFLSPQPIAAFNNSSNNSSRGGNTVQNLRLQSILNPVSFKRTGLVRPSINRRQGYGCQFCTCSSLDCCHTRLTNLVSHGPNQLNIGSHGFNQLNTGSHGSNQLNIGSHGSNQLNFGSYGSNQLNIGRPLVPALSAATSLQPNFSSPLITYPTHFQSQLAGSSQPYPNASFVRGVPSPSRVASWPSPNGFSRSIIAFSNNHLRLPSTGVISPHLNMANGFESQSLQQPPGHDTTAALLMRLNGSGQGNQTQIGARVSSSRNNSSVRINPSDFLPRPPNQQPQ